MVVKSSSLGSLHQRSAGYWRVHACEPAHTARPSADAKRNAEPKGYSFDDSRHPVLAIANEIAVVFLAMTAVASFALIADALLTRT